MIAAHRAVERDARDAAQRYAEFLKAEIIRARRDIADPPWLRAAFLSAVCFAFGAAFGGWDGAAFGGVTGAIVWKVVIEVARGSAAAALVKVEALQKESAAYEARLGQWLDYFSRSEEETGVRDPRFD